MFVMQFYSITDNINEIVPYLAAKYNFNKFISIMVSANIAVIKPSEKIYQHLLDQYQLAPGQTVFIDDLYVNVEGQAKLVCKLYILVMPLLIEKN